MQPEAPVKLPMLRRLATVAVECAIVLLVLWFVPHRLCSLRAPGWWEGRAELQGGLARDVGKWVTGGLSESDFTTGHKLFNGEWVFGTYQMAALGLSQTALEHPEFRERHAALMLTCIERMLSREVRAFDRDTWHEDPIDALDGNGGHAAYLGYLNLVLGMHRMVQPDSPYCGLNDRITEALARRFSASPLSIVPTYPDQAFPVDMAAGIGSLGLHDLVTGGDHGAVIRRWEAQCRSAWIGPKYGLLFQMVDAETGRPVDKPRGSGTALACYFLSFAAPDLSRELFEAMRPMTRTVCGFGAAREYLPGERQASGDIDSGPIVFGRGVSATGFMLAAARIHGDRELYESLFATTDLFGAPMAADDRVEFVTGGPLGNAMLLAFLTAQPVDRYARRAP